MRPRARYSVTVSPEALYQELLQKILRKLFLFFFSLRGFHYIPNSRQATAKPVGVPPCEPRATIGCGKSDPLVTITPSAYYVIEILNPWPPEIDRFVESRWVLAAVVVYLSQTPRHVVRWEKSWNKRKERKLFQEERHDYHYHHYHNHQTLQGLKEFHLFSLTASFLCFAPSAATAHDRAKPSKTGSAGTTWGGHGK